MTVRASAEGTPAIVAPPRSRARYKPANLALPVSPGLAYSGAVLSGLLYWLSFPGKADTRWHGLLALLAFVPFWIALQRQGPKRALWLGVTTGATMNLAGFYWLLDMLRTFSGFPTPLCMLFVILVCIYQGGRIGLMGWLYARATGRGWPRAVVFLAAFAASELLYPLLFPWYFAATTHNLPALSQTAELGGPILVGLVLVAANVALAEPILARLERRATHAMTLIAPAGALGLSLAFSAWRIPEVDRRAQASEPVHVGLVQGNMALIQKREDPAEGLRRHLRLTRELKGRGVELVVWSESSVTFPVPERSYKGIMRDKFARAIGIPAIFGGVIYRVDADRERWYNTALSTDARGEVTARYDKEYLLAFGEYLPLGETIPKLYEWSPNSGKFSPGTALDPMRVTLRGVEHKVSALICYEDILPAFTNKVVRAASPELLVNMTNDAWFGDTSEPWEHLALAQLRSIEHRRYLVRSTNSGISAFVDPVGRVMLHTDPFQLESRDAIVHFMQSSTVYEAVGDVPWWIVSAVMVVAAFVRRGGQKNKGDAKTANDALQAT
jgi:apolipoprotein N-acyltransferase